MAWDPTTYGVDDALKDMLCDGNVVNVQFTENGVMKEYKDGHITDFEKADNPKGHNSFDFRQDENGIWRGSQHSSNS